MENLAFHQVVYDLTIGKDFAQIDYVRGATDGLSVNVNLQKPDKKFKVLVDGKTTDCYTVSGNVVKVNVPFRACKIQIV